jgi:hypothetical protein
VTRSQPSRVTSPDSLDEPWVTPNRISCGHNFTILSSGRYRKNFERKERTIFYEIQSGVMTAHTEHSSSQHCRYLVRSWQILSIRQHEAMKARLYGCSVPLSPYVVRVLRLDSQSLNGISALVSDERVLDRMHEPGSLCLPGECGCIRPVLQPLKWMRRARLMTYGD